jgi:hypothetical protein
MALLKNAKGRRENQSPSGYIRVFGVHELGNLMSKVQGTVISAGSELEKLIMERCRKIPDLDKFVADLDAKNEGTFVATKNQVKQSKSINSKYEPDFLAFDLVLRKCYVIEVKDGDQFDTKKASSEHITLHNFTNDISQALSFSFQIYICSFNASTKQEIYDGLKHKFNMDEILTGRELCELFAIDYDEIVKIRTSDQQSNLEYFIEELLKMPVIKNMIIKRIAH